MTGCDFVEVFSFSFSFRCSFYRENPKPSIRSLLAPFYGTTSVQPNVVFGAGSSFYCAGQAGRSNLVEQSGWIISDGGMDPICDSDGDGMENLFENLYDFLNPYNPGDAFLDEDEDSIDNVGECIAGTLPDDEFSYPYIRQIAGGESKDVTFPSVSGRLYHVWYTDDPANPDWTQATSIPLVGTGGDLVWTDTGDETSPPPSEAPSRTYHLDIQRP